MRIQRVMEIRGVREKYVPGAGATPSRCDCRVGSAALVAPTPGTSGIENMFVADTQRICAGYEPDRFRIDR
jgi:hypothetical protein